MDGYGGCLPRIVGWLGHGLARCFVGDDVCFRDRRFRGCVLDGARQEGDEKPGTLCSISSGGHYPGYLFTKDVSRVAVSDDVLDKFLYARYMEDAYKVDTKSKIFFLLFFLAIVGAIGGAYYRFVVTQDYSIEANAECDPLIESCFVHLCDPEAGEECTGDTKEDTTYYKHVRRMAKNIPLCDPNNEDCTALSCPVGEADCEEILCDKNTVVGSERCSDESDALVEEAAPVEDSVSSEEKSSATSESIQDEVSSSEESP